MTLWLTDGWPVALVWVFFFAGAIARGGAIYWVGRGLRGAGDRRRRLAEHPGVVRAEAVVTRWGAPAVSLSFLTVGVQSAVNAAAGLLRMPARRYLPALVVGAALWATVYTTVGFAVLYAVLGGAGWWWLVVAALVALVTVGTWRARRRAATPDEDADDTPGDAPSSQLVERRSET
ncbi:DedA family protein [Nocardioides sp.]|uniref:DedA family protein n=1 Tax=Nocardioides sp. TaxID=35761 RepID=UPI003528F43D